MQSVSPQLGHNDEALRKMLARDAVVLHSGAVGYKVDIARFDRFFAALSYGVIYKACGASLPAEYETGHVYHNFKDDAEPPEEMALNKALLDFYSGEPIAVLNFGRINALNAPVYSVKVFGILGFKSSITVVHDFFGAFRVTSMLTKHVGLAQK
jgi:hypothetical protein